MKFYDIVESEEHRRAKELLFEKIKNNNIKIYDTYNNEYKFMTGEHENEFLHIESIVMTKRAFNQPNTVLLSGNNDLCDNFSNPYCNKINQYGCIGYTQCRECIEENIENQDGTTIHFIPDIAYGYEGSYKIWLEINYQHESTSKKIKYCYDKDIILLEVNADAIKNETTYLYMKNLTDPRNYEGINIDCIIKTHKDIEKYNYSSIFYIDKCNIPMRNKEDAFNSVLARYNLMLLFNYDEEMRFQVSPKLKKFCPIIITTDFYDKHLKKYNYDKNIDVVTYKDKVENLLTEDLKNNGFTKMKKYFEMLELKFGFYYSYQEIKSILQEFCNKHNYIMERTYDKKKYPKNGTAILIFDNLKCKPF